MHKEKRYIGDAVYVEFETDMFELTTNDGIADTNTIWLEWSVVEALKKYIAEVEAMIQ